MQGKLFGVGVGPGDPELMTLKSVRIIKEADVVVLPGAVGENTVAYKIALGSCPFLPEKEMISIDMPMTKDPEKRKLSHENATNIVKELLDSGKNVAFLTLGDPTVYATYIYVHKNIANMGYETEIISGITSFCAAAARLNVGLVEKDEILHVIPASYGVEEALTYSGTKVLMKAASKMKDVKEKLIESGANVQMVENCGMPNENIYTDATEIPDKSSYYSLIVVKETI